MVAQCELLWRFWDFVLELHRILRQFRQTHDTPLLITWRTLATIYATMPVWIAVVYVYECGRKYEHRSFRGLFRMYGQLWGRRKRAYDKVAGAFVVEPAISRLLASMFALAVALIGADYVMSILICIACVLLLPFAPRIGKHLQIPAKLFAWPVFGVIVVLLSFYWIFGDH